QPQLARVGAVLGLRPRESMLFVRSPLGRTAGAASSGERAEATRLRLEAVESSVGVRHEGALRGRPGDVSTIDASGTSRLGLITLAAKGAGARRAGNPPAACDVAGAGHVAMVER